MKAEIVFESFDMAGIMDIFGKKIPGLGFFGKTFVKNPKNLESFALPAVKKILKDKNIDVEVTKITINADGPNVQGVAMELGRINYASVGTAALPMLEDILKKKKPESPILKMMDILGSDSETLVRSFAANVSDAKKERLIETAVTEFQPQICEKFNGFIAKKKLPVKVAAVNAEA